MASEFKFYLILVKCNLITRWDWLALAYTDNNLQTIFKVIRYWLSMIKQASILDLSFIIHHWINKVNIMLTLPPYCCFTRAPGGRLDNRGAGVICGLGKIMGPLRQQRWWWWDGAQTNITDIKKLSCNVWVHWRLFYLGCKMGSSCSLGVSEDLSNDQTPDNGEWEHGPGRRQQLLLTRDHG